MIRCGGAAALALWTLTAATDHDGRRLCTYQTEDQPGDELPIWCDPGCIDCPENLLLDWTQPRQPKAMLYYTVSP